jgi:hypothetical protein
MTLEYAIRKGEENQLEVKLNKQRKLVVYDHDEDDNLLDYKIY